MPSEDTKILEFNQYQKSDKAPFIIYADLECIIEKINGCKNNPENSSTTLFHHIPFIPFHYNVFHQVFQFLRYLHLEAKKISIMYTEVKIVLKSFVSP